MVFCSHCNNTLATKHFLLSFNALIKIDETALINLNDYQPCDILTNARCTFYKYKHTKKIVEELDVNEEENVFCDECWFIANYTSGGMKLK